MEFNASRHSVFSVAVKDPPRVFSPVIWSARKIIEEAVAIKRLSSSVSLQSVFARGFACAFPQSGIHDNFRSSRSPHNARNEHWDRYTSAFPFLSRVWRTSCPRPTIRYRYVPTGNTRYRCVPDDPRQRTYPDSVFPDNAPENPEGLFS